MKKKTIIILAAILIVVAGFTDVNQIIKTYGFTKSVRGLRYVHVLNSYSNVYCTFYKADSKASSGGEVWDENATAMGDGDTVTHANAAVACTDHRTRPADGYLIPVPATIDGGTYDIKFYDNGTPAAGDAILHGRKAYIKGGNIQTWDDL